MEENMNNGVEENNVNAENGSESTELVKAEAAEVAVSDGSAVKEPTAASEEGTTEVQEIKSESASGSDTTETAGFIGFLKSTKGKIIAGAIGAAVILAIVLIVVLSGGKEDKNPTTASDVTPVATETPTSTPIPTATPSPTPSPTPLPTPTEEPTPSPTIDEVLAAHEAAGEMQSYINGNWVAKEIANQRPYCIMFNNIAVANPQSGTSCADILYEILVEGNITRLMGVFENLTEESSCKDRIGSVRSARHYYASIASEYDAIFIHYGETTYATKKIKQLGLDHLEGTYAEGNTVYYRDKSIQAPHNAFASLSGIWKAIENKKFRTEHKEDFVPQHFRFAYSEGGKNSIDMIENPEEMLESDTDASAEVKNPADNTDENEEIMTAALVKIPFSSYAQPYLTYDEETKLYTRYQFNGVHIDYNTQEPLKFNNIIIQIVQESNRDKNGYQDIEGYGDRDGHHNPVSGKGYYICEGKCIEITWKKNEAEFTCNYYTKDGELLVMRPGKTFIAVYPNFREDKLEIQ